MPTKARKITRKTDKERGIFTIPELRIAFEHIEDMVADMIKNKKPNEYIIKSLTEEWQNTFYRKLDKDSASAYIDYVREEVRMGRSSRKLGRKSTRKYYSGGGQQDATSPSMALNGAPLDSVTRAGIYPDAGNIPPESYGPSTKYIDSGFEVAYPEKGYAQDSMILPPTKLYPTRPEESGHLGGGRRRKSASRRTRKNGKNTRNRRNKTRSQNGGAPSWFPQPLLGAPTPRLIASNAPPSVQDTAYKTFMGLPPMNISPDPSQNRLNYLMGPKIDQVDISVSKIPINLKSDIRIN